MAPNISDRTAGFSSGEDQPLGAGNKERKEIYCDGYFYDVTDFIDRHPGGNVIKFYTEPGEDATQAIQQFHFRSRNKVDAILKSFKKRPALLEERGLEQKVLTRHEALSADFKKLFEELLDEGYFEPSVSHVFLRLLECVSLLTLIIGLFFNCKSFVGRFVCNCIAGFAFSRCGWVMHEGGHNSLTGNVKVDKFIQTLCTCMSVGGSAVWWNSQHNRHHAMPQRLNHDVDLSTLPFVAFHTRTVTDPSQINKFFVKFQGVFYWTLDMFLVSIIWRFYLHPRYSIKKGAYWEILLGLPSLWLGYHAGLFWYIMGSYWFAFFLGINFALSHSHLDVADKPTHWIEYSLTHTANIQPSLLCDFWMGYLNYQIEHHLFPTMPQFRQRQVMPRVKAIAEKYDLPYRVFSYWEACLMTMKNLANVGHELTSKDHFKTEQ